MHFIFSIVQISFLFYLFQLPFLAMSQYPIFTFLSHSRFLLDSALTCRALFYLPIYGDSDLLFINCLHVLVSIQHFSTGIHIASPSVLTFKAFLNNQTVSSLCTSYISRHLFTFISCKFYFWHCFVMLSHFRTVCQDHFHNELHGLFNNILFFHYHSWSVCLFFFLFLFSCSPF